VYVKTLNLRVVYGGGGGVGCNLNKMNCEQLTINKLAIRYRVDETGCLLGLRKFLVWVSLPTVWDIVSSCLLRTCGAKRLAQRLNASVELERRSLLQTATRFA
jgi:hypothetical protein